MEWAVLIQDGAMQVGGGSNGFMGWVLVSSAIGLWKDEGLFF